MYWVVFKRHTHIVAEFHEVDVGVWGHSKIRQIRSRSRINTGCNFSLYMTLIYICCIKPIKHPVVVCFTKRECYAEP